ncbi:MAG: PAS domain-containing protein [Methylophilus sp.]|nr:PAS domain-containing protein [Methylophilus sp.]
MLENLQKSEDQNLITAISKKELSELRAHAEAVFASRCVAEYTLSGKIISVNKNFIKLTGYTASELENQDIGMLLDLRYSHSADNIDFWERLNMGESVSGTYKRIGKGFKTIWIQAIYFPIIGIDGKPLKVLEHATDITEHVQLKQTIASTVREINTVVLAVKNNDLTQQVQLQGKSGEITNLCNDVNSMIDCMKAIINLLKKSSTSIITAAQKVNAASKAISPIS